MAATNGVPGTKKVSFLEGKVKMLSSLLDRATLAVRAGLQFGGDRDLFDVFGYRKTPDYDDYYAKYVRQDIASRIIDLPVASTWTERPIIHDDSGPEGTFAEAWEALVKEHRIYHFLERADKLAGIGRYAVVLLGFDKIPLSNPVTSGRKLLYLSVFCEPSADIREFVSDPQDERFGLPLIYELKLQPSSAQIEGIESSGSSELVHYSRVLHLAEGLLDDNVYGIPRLEKIINRLDDLEKVVGGSSETFWLTSNRGMQADIDKDMQLLDGDETALSDELDEYHHNLRRVIRTRGVTLKPLGTDTANPQSCFNTLIQLVSGATGIPQRILLGSERGALASDQDRRNWAERTVARQQNYAEPVVIRPLIQKLIEAGVLPEPDGDVLVTWRDPTIPTEVDRARTAVNISRAVLNITQSMKVATGVISVEEFRTRWLGLDPNSNDEDVELTEELVEEPVLDQPVGVEIEREEADAVDE